MGLKTSPEIKDNVNGDDMRILMSVMTIYTGLEMLYDWIMIRILQSKLHCFCVYGLAP